VARSFNQVVIMGNLTRDPDLRTTPNGGSVCSFSMALNRSYRNTNDEWTEATDYVDVVAWSSLAERTAKYISKGRPVLVHGRLQSRTWEKDGQKHSKVEVVAQEIVYLGGASIIDPQTKDKKDVVLKDIDEEVDLSEIPF
jgi:single-strand DNA-binding protein